MKRKRILKEHQNSEVGSMFDDIAQSYDFLNHMLSFGIDRYWRARAVRMLAGRYKEPRILDVASGTADLSVASLKLHPVKVTGMDISEKMLELGKKKISRKKLNGKIELLHADSENIPFDDNVFDIVMSAFGVRNFSDIHRGLNEMRRVLKKRGTIMILEFSRPSGFLFRHLYFFYFTKLLPVIGRVLSKHMTAYSYLPDTVMQFPDNKDFINVLRDAGFSGVSQKRMTGGIVSVYTGIKNDMQ